MERKSLLQKNAENLVLGQSNNILLIKDEVGKAKRSTRRLPPESFAFGKPEMNPNRETASQGKNLKFDSRFRISGYSVAVSSSTPRIQIVPKKLPEIEHHVA